MKNINKKELFIKLIPLFVTLLCCVVLVSYAYYKIKLEGQKEHFVSSDLISFTYKEGEDKIAVTNVTPVSDTDGKKGNYFEFNVSSNLVKDMSIDYEISILKTSTTNSFSEEDMKAYLTDKDDNMLVDPVVLSTLSDSSKITNAKVIYKNGFTYNNLNEVQTHTYRLRVWLKNDADLSKYTTKTDITDGTNITLPSYSFKFKVNVNTYEPTGADTLIALSDNKDNSGLYTITHAKDTTLQIGNDKDITEYRYRGASPKNYVTFNNEVWRIIGVFPTDDGTGKIENRIKLIRNESIGNKYWNTSGTNNWTTASLQTELNTTYLTGLTSITQNMIGNAKYYLGGSSTFEIQRDIMYQYERKIANATSNEFYYGTNPNSWIGKIALMYASDYGYAASEECTQNLYDYWACQDINWLHNIKTIEWLLSQFSGESNYTLILDSDGFIYVSDNSFVGSSQYAVRPTLYLNSSVKITGGTGTSADPYTLGL